MNKARIGDRNRLIWINGELLQDHDIRVLSLPPILRASKRVDRYTVPGRSGYLTVDRHAYDDAIRMAKIFYEGDDPWEVSAFIASAETVRFSNQPDRVYPCRVDDEIEIKRLFANWHQTTISFRCGLARELVPEVINGTYTVLINDTPCLAMPRIEVVATGTVSITLGDDTLSVSDVVGTLVLDSELGIVADNNGSAWSRTNGRLPELKPGESLMIESSKTMKIQPNWRWP